MDRWMNRIMALIAQISTARLNKRQLKLQEFTIFRYISVEQGYCQRLYSAHTIAGLSTPSHCIGGHDFVRFLAFSTGWGLSAHAASDNCWMCRCRGAGMSGNDQWQQELLMTVGKSPTMAGTTNGGKSDQWATFQMPSFGLGLLCPFSAFFHPPIGIPSSIGFFFRFSSSELLKPGCKSSSDPSSSLYSSSGLL